jgi:hypothetical protein
MSFDPDTSKNNVISCSSLKAHISSPHPEHGIDNAVTTHPAPKT